MSERVPAVELRHVTKAFGAHTVLDDVSFRVEPGRSLCILGRSGTGKSVTLKHIVGLMRPDGGSVLIDGEDITRLAGRELYRVRKRIGFLFQHAALFDSISVGENVAFPLRRHTRQPDSEIRARALDLLASVGLGSEYDKMPADLSGGMRKRAGLARALALQPAILLADEPSAGLDPRQRERVWDFVLGLAGGGANVIFSTHNIQEAERYGGRLLVLADGERLFDGTARQLHDAVVAEAAAGGAAASGEDFESAFVAFLHHHGH
jgi:phospholipid/cholesterol/gamma-HCH transport system ATP-binding protein